MPRAASFELVAGVGALAIVGALVYLAAKNAGGLITGDNALTKNAKDAQGRPVDYSGAGVVGTVGAAANAASGGWLASAGEWIGSKLADLAHPELTNANLPASSAARAPAATLPDPLPGWSFEQLRVTDPADTYAKP